MFNIDNLLWSRICFWIMFVGFQVVFWGFKSVYRNNTDLVGHIGYLIEMNSKFRIEFMKELDRKNIEIESLNTMISGMNESIIKENAKY
jgi:hypothetical protein